MGDRAFLVELGDEISPSVNRAVRDLFTGLESAVGEGVAEMVPGYRSLTVIHDPLRIDPSLLRERITALWKTMDRTRAPRPVTHKIPMVYGGECGPDLAWVADFHGISPGEVIRLHSQTVYRVYMIGFTPGFPYMGELPEALDTPRRASPRTHIPRGSVGIAQRQTGIYPVVSPGGWQIIGRTPIRLFDAKGDPPRHAGHGGSGGVSTG
ncbi:MAG: 5-oxoprolinase subunit PxpB [Desulfobacterales bacterium]|nr:5-oxoprolinase subunit PxpB [Desulfobacterales bacterium]